MSVERLRHGARGVAVGAPFLQLTGLPEATPLLPLGSCGQDWAITTRLDADWAGVRRMADVIGRRPGA
ncbi:MAG: hypothetical protein U0470_14785 [Anaerolineae bacterium]